MIHTHRSLDLDAASSVWFYRRFVAPGAEVMFQPANWDGAGLAEGDAALDLDCGIKGRHGADGRVHSCLATLVEQYASPEDRQALADLVAYVDLQDATGSVVKALGILEPTAVRILSATGLNAIFRALKAEAPEADGELLERLAPLFDALLEQGRSVVRAEREADQAQWVGQVAIQREAREFATMDVLFARGARAVVYVDGANLGVVRADEVTTRLDQEPLRALVQGEDRWFFHPSGFMAARGTRKAPVAMPSRVAPEALARVVDDVIRAPIV
jgi:hypothetical protein